MLLHMLFTPTSVLTGVDGKHAIQSHNRNSRYHCKSRKHRPHHHRPHHRRHAHQSIYGTLMKAPLIFINTDRIADRRERAATQPAKEGPRQTPACVRARLWVGWCACVCSCVFPLSVLVLWVGVCVTVVVCSICTYFIGSCLTTISAEDVSTKNASCKGRLASAGDAGDAGVLHRAGTHPAGHAVLLGGQRGHSLGPPARAHPFSAGRLPCPSRRCGLLPALAPHPVPDPSSLLCRVPIHLCLPATAFQPP